MHRHASATRRFYKAFYHWTLLTSPARALDHPTCSHIYRRGLAFTARRRQTHENVLVKAAGDDAGGFRIRKHLLRREEPPVTFKRFQFQGQEKAWAVPFRNHDSCQHNVERPLDAEVHQRQAPEATVAQAASTSTHVPWLSEPVQSLSQKPSDSFRAWEEVVRYRSSHAMMLEIAVPKPAVVRLSRRYGRNMRALVGEGGAQLAFGATWTTGSAVEELQSVAISGTLEEVQKVTQGFQEFGGVGAQKVKTDAKKVKENKAGTQLPSGHSSDTQDAAIVNSTTRPNNEISKHTDDNSSSSAKTTAVPQTVVEFREKRRLLESQRPEAAPVSLTLSELSVDAEKPFKDFEPWQSVVRSRDADNVVVERAIPREAMLAMRARYGFDFELLRLRQPLTEIVLKGDLSSRKDDTWQTMILVALSGPEMQVAEVCKAFNDYYDSAKQQLANLYLTHWRHSIGIGVRKRIPLRQLEPWEISCCSQLRYRSVIVVLAVPADAMKKSGPQTVFHALPTCISQLYPQDVEVQFQDPNAVVVNAAGQGLMGVQIRYPLSTHQMGTSVAAELRLAAETENLSGHLAGLQKIIAQRQRGNVATVQRYLDSQVVDGRSTHDAVSSYGRRAPNIPESSPARLGGRQLRTLSTTAVCSFTAPTKVSAQIVCDQPRAYSTATQTSKKIAWKHQYRPANGKEASRELPMPTAILQVIQKQHGQDLKGLSQDLSEQQVHIEVGETDYIGLCPLPGTKPVKYCEMPLSSVIVTASRWRACQVILRSLSKYEAFNPAVIGREKEEAQAEIDKMIRMANRPYKTMWHQPVLSEENTGCQDIQMGTFVVRRRPESPQAAFASVEDYNAAAAAGRTKEIHDHTWILEVVLPQKAWDYIDQIESGNVQTRAERFGIKIEVAAEGFWRRSSRNGSSERALMRSAKLVGPLEGVHRGFLSLRSAMVPSLRKSTEQDAIGIKTKPEAQSETNAANVTPELSLVSTQPDAVAQRDSKVKQGPQEPESGSTQVHAGAHEDLQSSKSTPVPEVMTARLQIAGDTALRRSSNTGKLFGDDYQGLQRLRSETACEIVRVASKDDGLFEVTGTLANVRRAIARIRDLVGTQQISTGDELALIHAAEKRMQEDMKTALRPLTHPVVIVTSRMAMMSNYTEQQQMGQIGEYRGVTVSSFNTVTLGAPGPPIISFNLKRPSGTWNAIAVSRYMCVHMLSATPTAAAAAQLFTKPYDAPEEPFKLLYQAGGFMGCKQQRSFHGVPEIWMAGVVLARVKARLLKEKCIHVGDHTVVVAKVQDVEFAPEVLRDVSGGNFAVSRLSEAETRRKMEQALGLAYANRAFRDMGEQLDASHLPIVRQRPEKEAKVVKSGRTSGKDEPSVNERASRSQLEHGKEGPAQYTDASAASDRTPSPAAPALDKVTEDKSTLERYTEKTRAVRQRGNDPGADANGAVQDHAKARRKMAQEEEDDYDLGFVRRTHTRTLELREEVDTILGSQWSGGAPRKRNDALLPSGARAFGTLSRRRLYTTATTPPVGKEEREHKEAPSKPADCVSDPSLLNQTVDEYLGLPPTRCREIPPMRALLKSQHAAARASRQLQKALSDDCLTSQQSLSLESEIAINERKVAKQLALRANDDLNKMLDTGKVDFRRVGWLEQTVERGMAVVVEEARILKGMFDRGEIGEEVFGRAKANLEMRHAELNEGTVRLRGMVEEEEGL